MARIGSIASGPGIASSRGGAPLGVRVGGVEGGRGVRLSPADLRINRTFGPAIKSPHQIGFGINPNAGLESVKLINSTKATTSPDNSLSRSRVRLFGPSINSPKQIGFTPEVPQGFETVKAIDPAQLKVKVARQIRPVIDAATPKADQSIPQIEAKAVKPVAELGPKAGKFERGRNQVAEVKPSRLALRFRVERQITQPTQSEVMTVILQKSLRARVLRARGLKAVTKTETQPQNSFIDQAQSLTEVQKTVESVTSKTKTEPVTTPTRIGTARVPEKVSDQLRPEIRRRYIAVDLETNKARLRTLGKVLSELQTRDPEVSVDGREIAEKSAIGTARSLRSKLLNQRGYLDREDGSQRRIEERLNVSRAVTRSELENLVDANTAVEATEMRPLRLATEDEVINVLNPPKSPFTESEPVVFEEVVNREGETGQASAVRNTETISQSISQSMPEVVVSEEAKVKQEEAINSSGLTFENINGWGLDQITPMNNINDMEERSLLIAE